MHRTGIQPRELQKRRNEPVDPEQKLLEIPRQFDPAPDGELFLSKHRNDDIYRCQWRPNLMRNISDRIGKKDLIVLKRFGLLAKTHRHFPDFALQNRKLPLRAGIDSEVRTAMQQTVDLKGKRRDFFIAQICDGKMNRSIYHAEHRRSDGGKRGYQQCGGCRRDCGKDRK